MRLCELRCKEVLNLCDCKRLGYVVDVMLDMCRGTVIAIIVPAESHICGFLGNTSEYVIPFECIKKVGPDIILVEICAEKFLKKC
ncbi:MAG: YlmC/YmxH family sporulation protein [Lachnospiraceae bacterium]